MSRQPYKEIYFHFNTAELKKRGLDKRAHTLITDFLVKKDFATFHSGYRSLDPMTAAEFYSILIELSNLYPWIRPCAEDIECLHVGELYTFDFTDGTMKMKDLRTGELTVVEDEQTPQDEEQNANDTTEPTPWCFVIELDDDKIKQYGTTVEAVRAAINEIAERNDMEEAEPGTWVVKPEAEAWKAQSLTIWLVAENKEIMRTVSTFSCYEGNNEQIDYLAILRKHSPQLLAF